MTHNIYPTAERRGDHIAITNEQNDINEVTRRKSFISNINITWHITEKVLRKVKPNITLKNNFRQDFIVPHGIIEEHYEKIMQFEDSGMDLLKSTGVVFLELFLGKECNGLVWREEETSQAHSSRLEKLSLETFEQSGKRERSQTNSSLFYFLADQGLPSIICIIISSLIERSNTISRYNSLLDLEEDLRMVMNDPDRFLLDAEMSNFKGNLEIPNNRLYGRDKAMSDLRAICKNAFISKNQSDTVLISGYSGTGKSSLVWNVEPYFTELGGFFISGKFDQMGKTAKPLSTIVAAFENYCSMVLQRDENYVSTIKSSIKRYLGSDISVLTDLIPTLSTIVGSTILNRNALVKLGGTEAMNRLDYLFRIFARSISSISDPVLLFLDDIQWADESSFRIIRSLVTDPQNTSLIFIGCYRDNQLSSSLSLDNFLKYVIDSDTINTVQINLGNMDKTCVNEVISDSLRLPRRLTRPLAYTIHRKTSGNPLFVTELFKSLAEEKLLRYSFSDRRWEWDIEKINEKDIANNIVDLMTEKMLTLPNDVQFSLQIAACFGASCLESDLDYLNSAKEFTKLHIKASLALAEEEGLMNRIGSKYVFSHDQIELVAYSLVLRRDIKDTHLLIGRTLCERISHSDFRIEDFIAVDQMNYGLSSITDELEKQELVRLNYRAGEKSIMFSDFSTGAKYFNAGKQLMGDKMWESHYGLSLELFTSSAETDYAISQFESMYKTLNTVIDKAKSFNDRLRPYYTLVLYLGTSGRLNEAISFTLNILEQLGESFPTSIDNTLIMDDLEITRCMLDGFSDDSLLQIGEMTDEKKIAAMQFLSVTMFTMYVSRPDLLILGTSRMVRLSLSYGLCRQSPFGFSLYGLVSLKFNEYKLAYRYGKISVQMMEKVNAFETLARIYLAHYTTITVWSDPLELSLEPLLHAHKSAMLCGDLEYARLNMIRYIVFSVLSGKPLKTLSEALEQYTAEIEKGKQNSLKLISDIYRQFILNLIGKSENALILTGSAMNQEELLKLSNETEHSSSVCLLNNVLLWLHYMFGEYSSAAEMAEASRQIDTYFIGAFEICIQVFFHGLTAAVLARTTNAKEKWMEQTKECKRKLKEWSLQGPWNCQQKYLLLKAEYSFSKGKLRKAMERYNNAIDISAKHRFIQDEAISCERAAIFNLECGKVATARDYFQRSHDLYFKWGAEAKVKHVKEKLNKIVI